MRTEGEDMRIALVGPQRSIDIVIPLLLTCVVSAAGNIPSFSEKMSGLAMTGLIMAVPGSVGGRIQQLAMTGTALIGGKTRDVIISSTVGGTTRVARWIGRRLGGTES